MEKNSLYYHQHRICLPDAARQKSRVWRNNAPNGTVAGTTERGNGRQRHFKKNDKRSLQEDYFHEIKEVELQDKKQAKFILTSDKYINRLVNQGKVSKAREQYKKLKKPKYQKISTEYGVLNYLVILGN